jgi:hypothetical protein
LHGLQFARSAKGRVRMVMSTMPNVHNRPLKQLLEVYCREGGAATSRKNRILPMRVQ